VGLRVCFSGGEERTYPDLGGDACAVGRFAGLLLGQSFPPEVLEELVVIWVVGVFLLLVALVLRTI
jgi:hypothetical protein